MSDQIDAGFGRRAPSWHVNPPDTRATRLDEVPAALLASVAPLFVSEAKGDRPLGTAFCIGLLHTKKALYATAWHSLQEFEGDPEAFSYLLLPRGLESVEEVRDLHPARITSVTASRRNSDVALLIVDLDLPSVCTNYLPTPFPLSFKRPVEQSISIAFGYPRMSMGEPLNGRALGEVVLHASQGAIEEVHERKRDESFVTFPSFLVNAEYPPGMSGAPIVSESGRVIGVVATDYEVVEDIPDTGYGAHVGAIAELRIGLPNAAGTVFQHNLADMIRRGEFGRVDSFLQLTRDADGMKLGWAQPTDEGQASPTASSPQDSDA